MAKEPLTPGANLPQGDPDPRYETARQELIAAIPEWQIKAKMAEMKYQEVMRQNHMKIGLVKENSISITYSPPGSDMGFASEDVVDGDFDSALDRLIKREIEWQSRKGRNT
jgi:hypothetical protein